MQFNSVRTGDYSQSAKAVTRTADKIFDTAMQYSPDFKRISVEAMKGRSLLRQTANKVVGKTTTAGIDAFTTAKNAKQDADTSKKVNDILRPSRRMAGIVGGLGTLAAGAVMYKGMKDDAAAGKKRDEESNARLTALENKYNSSEYKPTPYESIPEFDPSSLVPVNTDAFGATNGSSTNTSSTPSSSSSTASLPAQADGQSPGMYYMQRLTASGMAPHQAAAFAGHMDYESDGFRAMEEYVKNDYGTKGFGHLQWTDTPGSPRRTQFTNWAKKNNLKPSSLQANAGYLLHEMSHVPGIWTEGSSLQGFKGTKDLTSAVQYAQSNYIRPKKATANTAERLRRAQQYFDSWMSRNQ